MIKFQMKNGKAQFIDDVASEDGWVIEYDYENMIFQIWFSAEYNVLGNDPDYLEETLELAFERVKSFT